MTPRRDSGLLDKIYNAIDATRRWKAAEVNAGCFCHSLLHFAPRPRLITDSSKARLCLRNVQLHARGSLHLPLPLRARAAMTFICAVLINARAMLPAGNRDSNDKKRLVKRVC